MTSTFFESALLQRLASHFTDSSPIYLNFCGFLQENVHSDPNFLPFVQIVTKFLSKFFKRGHFGGAKIKNALN